MTAAIDARFAGGPILVGRRSFGDRHGVSLEMPGETAGLWPNEARALATALLEAADEAEKSGRRGHPKRRRGVDDRLMSLDA